MTTQNEKVQHFQNNNVTKNAVETLQMAYIPVVIDTLEKIIANPDNAQQTYNDGVQRIVDLGKNTENKEILRRSVKSTLPSDKYKFSKTILQKMDAFWGDTHYGNLIEDVQKTYVREGVFTWKDFNPLSYSASPSIEAYFGVNTNGQTEAEVMDMINAHKKRGNIPYIPV